MTLPGIEILDIVSLIFFVPATALSAWLFFKSGLRVAVIETLLLGVIRIVGSIIGIVAFTEKPLNITLVITSVVLSSIGLRFLLSAIVGMLKNVNDSMNGRGLSPRVLGLTQIPLLVAVILSIVGGTKIGNSVGGGQDAQSNLDTGRSCFKAGAVLFLFVLIYICGVAGWLVLHLRQAAAGKNKILFGAILTVPFLLVRVVYLMAVAFADTDSHLFSFLQPNALVQGMMAYFEEYCVVAILIGLAFMVPRDTFAERPAQQGQYETSMETRPQQGSYRY